MALGKHIIASRVPSNKILLKDRINALLFKPNDENDLANKPLKIICYPYLEKRLKMLRKNIQKLEVKRIIKIILNF